jgi:3',5'-nucleoside bisphosphate phosphatase
MLVDFHLHTDESDGDLAPAALALMLRQIGLDRVSITDHDTLAAYERHAAAFAPLAARLIRGVEVSTRAQERDIHLLAYGVPLGPSPLTELLRDRERLRRERVGLIVEKLRSAGIALTSEEVSGQTAGSIVGRRHIARAIVARGDARDISDAFDRYLAPGACAFVPPISPSPVEAIQAIRESGAIAVLAHPARNNAFELLPELVRGGLQGLEVFYGGHDAHETEHYKEIARRLGLVLTAGSDFHGPTAARPRPGMDVAPEDIDGFLELVAG